MSGSPNRNDGRLRKTDLRLDLVTPPQKRSRSETEGASTDPPAGISQEEIDILWRPPEQESRRDSDL
jgi:hypothetical protein